MTRILTTLLILAVASAATAAEYDVLIRNGTVYDGTGAAPLVADIGIEGDRIVAVGELGDAEAVRIIDASGLAVAPGFFNLLSHAHLSLITDGRAMSDLLQGVTFEVLSEISLSPITDKTAELWSAEFEEQGVEPTWRSLDEYVAIVESGGVSPNFALFVSAATVRVNVLGPGDVDPTPEQRQLQ